MMLRANAAVATIFREDGEIYASERGENRIAERAWIASPHSVLHI